MLLPRLQRTSPRANKEAKRISRPSTLAPFISSSLRPAHTWKAQQEVTWFNTPICVSGALMCPGWRSSHLGGSLSRRRPIVSQQGGGGVYTGWAELQVPPSRSLWRKTTASKFLSSKQSSPNTDDFLCPSLLGALQVAVWLPLLLLPVPLSHK